MSAPVERVISPRLLAITDRTQATAAETLARFGRLARGARPGSVMFQLRDRELSARERLAFGRELRALATAEGQWFQVNDRLDLALLLAADAVHLAEGSVAGADARRLLGERCFVSRACHDPTQAFDTDVDALVVSPIIAARKGNSALGLECLASLCVRAQATRARGGRLQIYALGGISETTAGACLAAGAAGVAVVGAALSGTDPAPLLAALGITR